MNAIIKILGLVVTGLACTLISDKQKFEIYGPPTLALLLGFSLFTKDME